MKTENCKSKQVRHLLKQVRERVSLHRAFDQFQGALICVDQFGFCAGLTMGFFMLISFLLQAAHSGAEKGAL